jgi:hypothetical protein
MTLGVQVRLLTSWHEYSLDLSRVFKKKNPHVMDPRFGTSPQYGRYERPMINHFTKC